MLATPLSMSYGFCPEGAPSPAEDSRDREGCEGQGHATLPRRSAGGSPGAHYS